MWQHIGKREIAFCNIIEFFNVQAFDPLNEEGNWKVWSLLPELEENIPFFVNKFNFTT